MFSGDIERDQWLEMGSEEKLFLPLHKNFFK